MGSMAAFWTAIWNPRTTSNQVIRTESGQTLCNLLIDWKIGMKLLESFSLFGRVWYSNQSPAILRGCSLDRDAFQSFVVTSTDHHRLVCS